MFFRRTWQLASVLASLAACPAAVAPARGETLALGAAPVRSVVDELSRLSPPGVRAELNSLEARLFEAAAGGRTDCRWLLSAICVAGGEQDENRIEERVRRVEAWVETLRSRLAGERDVRRRAEAALEYLYREILHGGYQAEATDLAGAIDGGAYNCVSSTVLFNCLAQGCALDAAAIESPGHVFSVIDSPDGPIDVETTCREWFRSGPVASSSRGGARRRLSAAGLVALVYYNRGVDLLEQRRFAEAIVANLKALQLDPLNPAARSNWQAGLNNWALDCNGRDEFASAVRLLRHGLIAAPEHRPFRINFVAVHQRWIDALLAQEQYGQALELLRQAHRDLPQESYFEAAAAELDRRMAQRDAAFPRPAAEKTWSVMYHGATPTPDANP